MIRRLYHIIGETERIDRRYGIGTNYKNIHNSNVNFGNIELLLLHKRKHKSGGNMRDAAYFIWNWNDYLHDG